MSNSYIIDIAWLRRELPLFRVAFGVKIALPNTLGDTEMVLKDKEFA